MFTSMPAASFALGKGNTKGDLRIVTINENLSEIYYGNIKCIASKTDSTVQYKYFVDGEEVYNFNGDLQEAIDLGNEFKRVNGKAPLLKTEPINYAVVVDPGGGGNPSGTYSFDGVLYTPKSSSQPYAHLSKTFYSISKYNTWSKDGNDFTHVQLDMYDSNSILQMPPWMIGSGLGAAVGALIGKTGGAIIGGGLGAYFGGQMGRLADEDGCLWLVMDHTLAMENIGASWSPVWAYHIKYISVGPLAIEDYYYVIAY